MATLTERPIIKSIAEDTTNKNSPNQTAIGQGVEYASLLSSPETNGFSYILSEAVKNLQRTGGMYSTVIPYSAGQSCSVLCKMGTQYGIRRFVCSSATEITDTPPLTGATITTVNGVSCYSGGVLSTSWQDADCIDGYAATAIDIPYDTGGSSISVPGFGAINVGQRQYVNVYSTTVVSTNPETNAYSYTKAPDLDEVLSMIGKIYWPSYQMLAEDVSAFPIRRLGIYNFRGQKVEAFGVFIAGKSFADDGISALSKFYRSTYLSPVIASPVFSQNLSSGTEGGTITIKDYRGRVQVCEGIATLSSGTSEARASLGGVQDDQMQGHRHNWTSVAPAINAAGSGGLQGTSNVATANIGDPVADTAHGAPRVGYNTREATFTGPVPMVVSLLPYGEITL